MRIVTLKREVERSVKVKYSNETKASGLFLRLQVLKYQACR